MRELLRPTRPSLLPLASLLSIIFFAGQTLAFQKSQCNKQVQAALQNGSISPVDDIFYRHNGVPMSNASNIILTLNGCRATCGTGASFYEDVGPRLTTWLIPILLLIGNMKIARLGAEKYFMVLHLLGDPIDSIWSLLTTAEAWSRCYAVARQTIRKDPGEEEEHYERRIMDVGTIYSAMEELDGPGTDRFRARFDQILVEKREDMSLEHFYHVCKEVANELSDSRSIDFLRAGLAVLSYVYGVIAGFVSVIGGESSSPPGGRIATAMSISWLIPAVLISNAIGGFTSRRTCLRIMERFVKTVTGHTVEDRQLFSQEKQSSFLSGKRTSATNFYTAQQWHGAVYSYRPQKRLFPGGPHDKNAGLLLVLAILPPLIANATSFGLLWVTPTTGLGCRQLLVLGTFSLWLISAAITWSTWSERFSNGKYHYIITMTKDALIGVPILIMVILSSCGLFNSCYCWSAVFSRGEDAQIVLDDADERGVNARTYYPGFVVGCIVLQFAVFLCMLFIIRHGSALYRRDEQRKQDDWLDTHERRWHLKRVRTTPFGAPAEERKLSPIPRPSPMGMGSSDPLLYVPIQNFGHR
jgi:hypothetical protein